MTILGKKARNHPQQLRRRGTDDTIDDRRTPRSVFEPLNALHSFTLDAAASGDNAKCAKYFTRIEDGTVLSWARERVWCNPPYSHIEPWVTKAWNAMRSEHCQLVCMLLPQNRTEQGWWQTHVRAVPRPGAARRRPADDAVSARSDSLWSSGGRRFPQGRPPAVRAGGADLDARQGGRMTTYITPSDGDVERMIRTLQTRVGRVRSLVDVGEFPHQPTTDERQLDQDSRIAFEAAAMLRKVHTERLVLASRLDDIERLMRRALERMAER